MVQTIIDWMQTNALFTGLVAAFAGVYLQSRRDREKDARKRIEQQSSYLRYWREELEYNLSILHQMKTFIGGPRLPWAWNPLQSFSNHFRKTAWDSIVKEGLLSDIPQEDQVFYRITNRSILDVSLEINSRIANWDRIESWESLDKRNNNPQPASLDVFYEQSNIEIKQRIEYAIKNIQETLEKLPRVDGS